MSLERSGVDSASFYLSHAPDPETPIEQTLEGFAAGIESKQIRTSVVARDRERGQLTVLALRCFEGKREGTGQSFLFTRLW